MAAPTASGPDRRLLAGCAGGAALAALASWLRLLAERTGRLDTGTPAFLACALLAGAGLGLAGACALRLGSRPAGAPRALLGWALLAQLLAALALPLTSTDLFSNLAHGELQLRGLNPYLAPPAALGPGPVADLVPARWAVVATAYGPLTSLASRLAAAAGAALGSPLWGGAAAFKLLALACALATVGLAWRQARALGPEEAAGRFALVGLSPLLAWELSGQAHNDALLVLALMAFVAAARRGRDLVAGLALAAGALAKAPAAPLLVLYLALLARRSRPRALLVALGAAALAVAAFAPYWHGLETLRGPGAAAGGTADRHAHSLADLICLVLPHLGAGPEAVGLAYRACWVGSIVACAAVGLRGLWRARSLEAVLHDGLTLFLVYDLTAPWFQPWYAAWLLPLALVERDAALRRLVAVYAVWTVVQWALPLDPFSTVAVNAWVAVRWWRLTRARREEAPQVAAA